MINDSWHSYPSVFALGHSAISELLNDPVLIEEKIDGSQFSFGIFDGEIQVRSRGKEFPIDAPEKMFSDACRTVIEIAPLLWNGWTYRGEYLSKPKHNVVCYGRVPSKNIIIYDINTGEEEYLSYADKKAECERIGLEIVPLLFYGRMDKIEALMQMLETDSILGGSKIEGVVIKNYARFGRDKKALMGKYVSEKFKEKHANLSFNRFARLFKVFSKK